MEKPYVVLKRLIYQRKYLELLGKKYFIYLDETWTFLRGTSKTREWQDDDIRSCSVKTIDKGARFIITHAGGRRGFVEGASMFFCSKENPKDHDDYHGDMCKELFEKWFKNDLLPNLPKSEPCVIVMDNAKYHSAQVFISIFEYLLYNL